jgi:GTP-binding protein SAR1
LTTGRITQLDPTKHEHAESVKINNVNIKVFDLGGHLAMRKIWRQHFMNIHGIVYVVDSADPARFQESKTEFEQILNSEEL